MGLWLSVNLFYKHIYHLSNILAGKGFIYSMTCNILAPNYAEITETHCIVPALLEKEQKD
jgi:hypothetical protein